MVVSHLVSPVMGTVASFFVDDGAEVAAGDTVVEIESMKTFFSVAAETAGIVRLKVALGEVVGEDDVLAEIEQK